MNQVKGNQDIFLNNKLDELINEYGERNCFSARESRNDRERDPRDVRSEPNTPKKKKQTYDIDEFDLFQPLPLADNVYAEPAMPKPVNLLEEHHDMVDADIQANYSPLVIKNTT